MIPIRMIQTAAGDDYIAMLRATEPVHQRFAERNGITFTTYEGVIRGSWNWQSIFNRISLINDLIDQGFAGWVLYLDADAVICDPDFPIRDYLDRHADKALIAVSGTGAGKWDINDGVFFLNLSDHRGQLIARRWRELFLTLVTDQMLAAAEAPWQPLADGRQFPDDQHLLQVVLMQDPALQESQLLEYASFMNYGAGSFIRQVIRERGDDRVAQIKALIAEIEAAASKSPPRLASLVSRSKNEAGHSSRLAQHYDLLFGSIRRNRFTMLRLGPVGQAGGTVLPTPFANWLRYLPHADIMCISRENHARSHRPRLLLHQVDPANLPAIAAIVEGASILRIVLDVASENTGQQLATFSALFPSVERSGWHVIESATAETESVFRNWSETRRLVIPGADGFDEVACERMSNLIGDVHILKLGANERAISIRRRDA